MKILLWTLLSALALMLVSCGSKDKPNGPTNLDPGIYLPNGVVYKGETGAAGLTPQLKFGVADADGNLLKRSWLIVDLVRGDGALPDSVQTGSDGYATLSYTFSDTLGYADVELMSRDYDTVQVRLRANLMKPGAEAVSGSDTTTIAGQGEYVIFDDTYGSVLEVNGSPERVDPHPRFCILYMVYEESRGVVVPIEDYFECLKEEPQPFERVMGVIVNSVYGGSTADGLRIGSSLADVRSIYGEPDDIVVDIDSAYVPPVALRCNYDVPDMIFWADPETADTSVFEIHFYWKPMPIVIGAPEDDSKIVPGAAAKTERPESSLRELQYQWRQATAR